MKRIGEIINPLPRLSYKAFLIASEKARRRRRSKMRDVDAPPIGRMVGINVFEGSDYRGLFFADCIDVCRSHTTIHWAKNKIEVYTERPQRIETRHGRTTVYYRNNTSLEIIRLN